jgi:hypothetical protein
LTFEEVVRVAALAAMTKRGIKLGTVVEILHAVEPDFLRAIRYQDGHGAVLLVEGDKPWIGNAKSLQPWLDSWTKPADDRRPVDAYVLLLGPLVAHVRKSLAELEADG